MSCCELELACLIPKAKPEELLEEPYVSYKGTDYKKTLRFRVPSWKPIKSRIKRFWHWICFVWLHSRSRKCRKITFLLLFTIFLILFTIIYITLPVAFKYSVNYQRFIIFNPISASHDSFNKVLELYKYYDVKTFSKPKNIYVVVNNDQNYKLGVWDFSQQHVDSYLLFFHDGNGNRDSYIKDYSRLMPYFHIVTFDYRGYGDSAVVKLNETGLVQDGVEIFKWLKSQTNSSIFIWGDTLGAAIATHAVAELKKENLSPCGLMLENPFTTMGEELGYSWFIARMNWYMPWYTTTVINPLKENDLSFNTSMYINKIDCPIHFWEWNDFRAKEFDIHDVQRQEVRDWVKRDYSFGNQEYTNFLRSFISFGENYCNRKVA